MDIISVTGNLEISNIIKNIITYRHLFCHKEQMTYTWNYSL